MNTLTQVMQVKPSVVLREAIASGQKEVKFLFSVCPDGGMCSHTYLALRAGLPVFNTSTGTGMPDVAQAYGLPYAIGDRQVNNALWMTHDGHTAGYEEGGFAGVARWLEDRGF